MFNSNSLIKKIKQELKSNASVSNKISAQNFHKEKITNYGVKTPIVRKIANKYFKLLPYQNKQTIIQLSEKLLKSNYNEEATIAIQWLNKIIDQLDINDFKTLNHFLEKYINNWGKVDDFSLHVIRPLLNKYTELNKQIIQWSKHKNKWVRRASAVSFIKTINNNYAVNDNIDSVVKIINNLKQDSEEIVLKSLGWLLKRLSIFHINLVEKFLIENKNILPKYIIRTALEKIPESKKLKILSKIK